MKDVKIIFGITKAGLVRAGVASKKPETIADKIVSLTGIGSYVDNVVNQETGETEEKVITVVGYKDDNGLMDYVSSPSETLKSAIELLTETYTVDELNGKDLKVMFTLLKSNSGRKFITMFPAED